MLENKLQNMKSGLKNGLIGAFIAVIGCISGCGPNYIPATYTPPPTTHVAPTALNSEEVKTYFSNATYCQDLKIGNVTVTCKSEECDSYATYVRAYCGDVDHPATKGWKGEGGSPAYTSRECGVREERDCERYSMHTRWELSTTDSCLGVTTEYKIDKDDGTTADAVVKVQYVKSTQKIPFYNSSNLQSFTNFINQHYCNRN